MFWKPFQALSSHILENANKESATIQCFGQRTFLRCFTRFKVFFQCFPSFKVSSKMCKTQVSWLLLQTFLFFHTLNPKFIFFPHIEARIYLFPHCAPFLFLPTLSPNFSSSPLTPISLVPHCAPFLPPNDSQM